MNEILKAIETIGIPVAGAVGLGYLVCTLFKYLIADITKKLTTHLAIIVAFIDRIRQMDNDMIRIDAMVRAAMNLPPDVNRMARSDGKKDTRKD